MNLVSKSARSCALGLAVACAPSDPEAEGPIVSGACTDDEPSVTVGSGDVGFVALSDDDPVTIVFGPQGGWHVDVAGTVTNMNQEVSIAASMTLISESLQIAGDQLPEFRGLASYDDEACAGQFWGVRVIVDDVPAPPGGQSYAEMICSFEGQAVEIGVTVEDLTTGIVTGDSTQAVVQLDPAAKAACR